MTPKAISGEKGAGTCVVWERGCGCWVRNGSRGLAGRLPAAISGENGAASFAIGPIRAGYCMVYFISWMVRLLALEAGRGLILRGTAGMDRILDFHTLPPYISCKMYAGDRFLFG